MRVDAPVLDDQEVSVVVEFCRVAVAAPVFDDEREHFDEVAGTFARPRRRKLFRSHRFDPPTGAGFDFPMLLEQLLPLAAILWQATANRVAENTVDGLGRATADRVRKLMRRRPPELTSPEAYAEAEVDAGTAVGRRLTQEDEAKIFAFVVERAVTLGMAEERARLLAESLIGAFRLGGDHR
jgi:hypothetical protein